MAESNRGDYYHFAWNGSERSPALEPPSITTKARVAKILRETELESVPDLVFRSPLGSNTSSRDKTKTNAPEKALRSDHELFSIDDEDWVVEEVNTEDNAPPRGSQTYGSAHVDRPIYTSRVSTVTDGVTQPRSTRQFDTYIDDAIESKDLALKARAGAKGKQPQSEF